MYKTYPGNLRKSKEFKVVYQEFDAWTEDISKIKTYDELPINCKKYIEFIENYLEVKISMISVGPERTQNIYRTEF